MKFEKFAKSCATRGFVCERSNGSLWLVCGGIGMEIPDGVVSMVGAGKITGPTANLVEALVRGDTDDKVKLVRAEIPADGKASDIVRIFSDPDGITEVGITNAAFGLLEKSDYNLAEVEVEDADVDLMNGKYLLILDSGDEVVGFIHEAVKA